MRCARIGLRSRGLGLLWLALVGAAGLFAAGPEPAPPAEITSVAEFWNFTGEARRQPHTVRMELTVYFYDSGWNLLYGEVGGAPSYWPMRGQALPIKSGQKVRLEGSVVTADGFDGAHIKATVLAEGLLPEPVRAAGRIDDFAALHSRWTEIEGYVLGQNEPDPTHIQAQFLSESRLIDLTILINGTDPVPQLTGARIRVAGVYDAVADATGRPEKIQLWTSERVQLLGWLADDERFKLPPTPIDELNDVAGQPWVHLVGEAWAQEPGRTLTLRDESAQMVIATAQPEALPARAAIEVVGRPVRHEQGWTLQDPLFRRRDDAPNTRAPNQAPQRLRLAEHVLRLTPEEANRHQEVGLRGVVTWFDERSSYFYLQDTSGGVRVRREPGPANGGLAAGASVAVAGGTTHGAFTGEVELRGSSPIGPLGLPVARSITLEQALAGTEEGRRVEMRGYVRQVRREGRLTRLELTAAMGEFSALLPTGDALDYLQGAIVRMKGVCTVTTDAKHEISGVELLVQDRDAVVAEVVPARDPFALPLQTTAGLRRFPDAQAVRPWVRLEGVVQLHEPGRSLYLQDRDGGLLVLSRNNSALPPDTWIEVVGLPGRAGNRMALREATWRIIPARGPAIAPRELRAGNLLDPAADIQLVRVETVLRQVAPEGQRLRLSLEAGDMIFEGTMPAAAGWVAPAPGSRLALTGVYVLEFDDYRQPRGFRLELRSPADVVVLATPSWWTIGRTLGMAGLLATASAAILFWVIALRRRVDRQTRQIRAQLEKEARMQGELERATRLESLGVLAGGIAHDFNNLLTVILGNLGLAAMDERVMTAAGDCISEAQRGARRARDVTQQLLTFAKGGDPVCTSVFLPDVVSEAANFARHGSKVRFDMDYPPDLPAGNVDAGQISRVVHNLVMNAVQAMPNGGVIKIALAAATLEAGDVDPLPAGAYVRFTITDTGKGIAPEHLSRIFDPYFSTKGNAGNSGLGLATVRSIVKKHRGHIEVESRPGDGTTFRIWLPAAQREPSVETAPLPLFQERTPARVLVMDDEDIIRRVAGRMLSLAGHEIVFAADGAEAIQAYTAARQAGSPFDLVIFDLTVPGGMGGKDALAELLKVDPAIRAIASSGYSNDPVMANPQSYGFCTSLPKPYDISDLLRAIDEARRP